MPDIALPRSSEEPSAIPLSGDALRPLQLIAVLRRHWPMIAAFGLAAGALAYLGALTLLPKKYSATGLIGVDSQTLAIPALEGALKGDMLPDPMPQVHSEVQKLQSPALIRTVVQQLHLAQDPEFNPLLRPPTLMQRVRASIDTGVLEPLQSVASSMGLQTASTQAPPPGQVVAEDATIGEFVRNLSVSNDGQSLVIVVQYMANTGGQASTIVNTLMQQYIAEKKEIDATANQQANAALTQRLNQVRDEVASLEKQIQDERQHYQLVQTRAGSVGQQELEDLSTALTHATDQRAALEASFARAQALSKSGGFAEDSAAALGSATVGALRDKEAAAARRVAQLSSQYGPQYPELRAAEAQLASARSAIAAEGQRSLGALGAQMQAARQHEADMRNQLKQAQAKASDLAIVQAKLQQLDKDVDARRQLYQSLLIGAEQTQNSGKNPEQVNARVISSATPPVNPSSPRPKIAGGIGLLGGLAFGGLLTLLRGDKHAAFSRPDELTEDTGIPVLAAVQRVSSRVPLARTVATDASDPNVEALRLLRNKIRFGGRRPVPRAILFASSVPGEGSTSLAAAFSRTAALDGMRVLLIETNLKYPSLGEQLDAPPSNGVVEALRGNAHWRDLIAPDQLSSLECLLADGAPYDGERLLESMQLQNLIAEAREDYNFVVLDAQAITESTESVVLAHMVDAVILVVEAGATSRSDIHSAIEAIESATSLEPFIILNKA